jgi:Xaa-Pro dipeptidase
VLLKLSKRNFLKASGTSVASLILSTQTLASTTSVEKSGSKAELKNIIGSMKPINSKERLVRVAKAQKIMQQLNISALIIEPGASMDYFSGIQWWRSERMTALIIPKEGDIAVVCPFFEEPSIRESMSIGDDVRVWQEHESPFEKIKQILVEKSLNKGDIAFEKTVRYFVLKGVMAELSSMQHVKAEPIIGGCRMYKSHHELELMHKANQVTLTAYAAVWPKLQLGMTQADVKQIMNTAQTQLGGSSIWNMALFNEASAYPHGTNQKQTLVEGSTVLMDCGCSVHGYQSDISRTFIYGEGTQQQKKIWKTVRQGQQIAFEKAQVGVEAGQVDDAVRQYYEKLGFGPDYKLPGLSHRTGHGIGMEGHEDVNFVHNEQQQLKPGMCFSNEPGIYLPGKFGVRLEDCIYMTEKGPQWFTEPPSSFESPIGRVVALSDN